MHNAIHHNCISVQTCTIALILLVGYTKVIALRRSDLFPFGKGPGDESPFRNDDDNSLELTLPLSYMFFGMQISTASYYINNNGAITFTDLLPRFSDDPFPLISTFQTVAVFYGDVDTRGHGELFYRITSTEYNLLEQVDDIIHAAFVREERFVARNAIVATWDAVGYYNQATDLLNTFQCVIVSDNKDTFVLFLYVHIQWTRANNRQNFAQVGFNAGDGVNYYILPGSQSGEGLMNLTETSNVGIPGIWAFKISGPFVEMGPCTSEPGGVMLPTTLTPDSGSQLGGNVVSVQGPCFSEGANIQCDFGGQQIMAHYDSDFEVHCTVPHLPESGIIPFRLLIDGGVRGEANYTASCTTGAYQSSTNSCEPCPANTVTDHVMPVTECSCISGFYRTQQEGPEVGCTEPPSACNDIQVSIRTPTSLTATWSRPDTTGRSDFFYRLLYSDPDADGQFILESDNLADSGSTMNYNIRGLDSFTSYTVRVTTHNGVSDQDPNAYLRQCEVSAMTAEGVPGQPSMFEQLCTAVVWREPVQPNGIIVGYDIIFSTDPANVTRVDGDVNWLITEEEHREPDVTVYLRAINGVTESSYTLPQTVCPAHLRPTAPPAPTCPTPTTEIVRVTTQSVETAQEITQVSTTPTVQTTQAVTTTPPIQTTQACIPVQAIATTPPVETTQATTSAETTQTTTSMETTQETTQAATTTSVETTQVTTQVIETTPSVETTEAATTIRETTEVATTPSVETTEVATTPSVETTEVTTTPEVTATPSVETTEVVTTPSATSTPSSEVILTTPSQASTATPSTKTTRATPSSKPTTQVLATVGTTQGGVAVHVVIAVGATAFVAGIFFGCCLASYICRKQKPAVKKVESLTKDDYCYDLSNNDLVPDSSFSSIPVTLLSVPMSTTMSVGRIDSLYQSPSEYTVQY